MSKTIAVVGAGPGIGLAVGRRFGSEGYKVALIARNEQSLGELASSLKESGIEASTFKADVLDPPSLVSALSSAAEQLGEIDVLYYGPAGGAETLATPRNITPQNVQYQFDFAVIGAVSCVIQVLPGMLERKSGAVLFTTAASAITPVPFSANFAVANAGLRSYAQSLNNDLAPEGIFVGIVPIAGVVDKGGDASDPAALAATSAMGLSVIGAAEAADILWDMFEKRDRFEEVAGDIDALHRLLAGAAPGAE